MTDQRDRPATEEVTPAMIEAGETALIWFRETYPDRELVAAVYTAMAAAKSQPKMRAPATVALAEATDNRPLS